MTGSDDKGTTQSLSDDQRLIPMKKQKRDNQEEEKKTVVKSQQNKHSSHAVVDEDGLVDTIGVKEEIRPKSPHSPSDDDERDIPLKKRRFVKAFDDYERNIPVKKHRFVKLQEEEKEVGLESKINKPKQDEASGSNNGDAAAGDDALARAKPRGGKVNYRPKPIGDMLRVSVKNNKRWVHYEAFEYRGARYELEDSVVLAPEYEWEEPYVGIMKDITWRSNDVKLLVQWFYRPENAEIRKVDGNWNTMELFCSFHYDDVYAEAVMHKCVVHYIPSNKQIPKCINHTDFIVQRVYDTYHKRLFELTDYEVNKQHELDLLVQKTLAQIGDIPDTGLKEGLTAEEIAGNKPEESRGGDAVK